MNEEILKEEKDRDNLLVLKREVLRIIKDEFDSKMNQLKVRSLEHQSIIGDTLTDVELEIKKQIKSLE